MRLVLSRLKKYKLDNYANSDPILFIYADDPDHACFKAYDGLTKLLLKQKKDAKNLMSRSKFIKDVLNDIRVIKCVIAQNEKKF